MWLRTAKQGSKDEAWMGTSGRATGQGETRRKLMPGLKILKVAVTCDLARVGRKEKKEKRKTGQFLLLPRYLRITSSRTLPGHAFPTLLG